MRDGLLIIGAGGHGKVLADIAIKMKRWHNISFLDDNNNIKTSMGFDVIGKVDDAIKYIDNYDFIIGIGNNYEREKLQLNLESLGASIATLIHPDSVLGMQVIVGEGTVVMAGTIINCCTTIGKGCIINTGSTIDHDNLIDDFSHISPGVHLAGSVRVGKATWLGLGSIVINNIIINSGCIIGAGAVVVKDLSISGTYAGIPARLIHN